MGSYPERPSVFGAMDLVSVSTHSSAEVFFFFSSSVGHCCSSCAYLGHRDILVSRRLVMCSWVLAADLLLPVESGPLEWKVWALFVPRAD